MKKLPVLFIIFRMILIPVFPLLAHFLGDSVRLPIVILMYLGLISDIFDGIIARKYHVATEKLWRMDSQTDLFFWLSIGISCWILNPEIIRENSGLIISLFILEGFCYLLSFLRFGKETSTHAYSAKLWGLSLLLCFTSMIGFNYGGFFFYQAIIIGYISYLDIILILLLLPRWTHDIPSCYHAYLIRKNIAFKKHDWFH